MKLICIAARLQLCYSVKGQIKEIDSAHIRFGS